MMTTCGVSIPKFAVRTPIGDAYQMMRFIITTDCADFYPICQSGINTYEAMTNILPVSGFSHRGGSLFFLADLHILVKETNIIQAIEDGLAKNHQWSAQDFSLERFEKCCLSLAESQVRLLSVRESCPHPQLELIARGSSECCVIFIPGALLTNRETWCNSADASENALWPIWLKDDVSQNPTIYFLHYINHHKTYEKFS